MTTTDWRTIRDALWIARDLSIKMSGEVPKVVTEAPAALARLVQERDDALAVLLRLEMRAIKGSHHRV